MGTRWYSTAPYIVIFRLSKKTSMIYSLCFSPAGIEALFKSFPDFSQKKTKIAVYGDATLKAAEEAGLIIDIKAPSPESPSMTVALDHYLGKQNSKK